ncbi:hypothetical protein JCM8547_003507 [Rhodosporidiobolus lusitaniae]
MPSLKALWRPFASVESLQRSSHGLAVVQGKGFVFGGERQPRLPVDAAVAVLDLDNDSTDTLSASSSSSWPSARVGASVVSSGDRIYVWGGRGGKEMGTFAGEKGSWAFDPSSGAWEELATKGDQPEPRSFHTMTTLDNKLYLHAGCPASGRSAQLHSLDLSTLTWTRLPDAPEPPRGGTVLTPLPPSTASSRLLARFGGFAGHELGGLDVFNVKEQAWKAVAASVEGGGEGPGKRSVHVFAGLEGTLEWEDKRVVAVMALGEKEGAPKELGHDGAGFFHADAWALLATKEASPTFSWLSLEPSSQTEKLPEARGWLASSFWEGNKVVLQGGLNAKNERLSDAWTLEVVLE